MKIKYNIGTMYSNTDDYIKSIENDLIEHNIINETDSREQILEKVENFVDTISPDIIKGNISIFGVAGTVADNINDINIEEGTWRKVLYPDYDFTQYTGYKNYFVCGYSSGSKAHPGKTGLYLVDTITDETTVLCETGYWSYSYTTTDNVLYVSSAGDSAAGGGIGYIEIVNDEVKFNHLFSGAGDWRAFYETDKYLYVGNRYLIMNSGNFGGIFCITKETKEIKHLGLSRAFTRFTVSKSGNLYASIYSPYHGTIARLIDDTAIALSRGAPESWDIVAKNEDYIYFVGTSNNYKYIHAVTGNTITLIHSGTAGAPYMYQTKHKGIYCKPCYMDHVSEEYTGEIYYLYEGKCTFVYNVESKWANWLELPDGTVFVNSKTSSDGMVKLVDDKPGVKVLSSCSGGMRYYISKSGRTYVSASSGYTYYSYNGVEKELAYNINPISVIDYTEFFYVSNGSSIYKVTDDVIESLGAGYAIGEISTTSFYTISYDELIKWENGVRTTISKLKQGYGNSSTFFVKTKSNVVLLKNSILYIIDPKDDSICTFNQTINATKGEETTDDVVIFYNSSDVPIYKLIGKKLYKIK